MKHFYAILVSMLALSMSIAASAKDNKKEAENDHDKEIIAKVWFKDGSIYNGQLVKH